MRIKVPRSGITSSVMLNGLGIMWSAGLHIVMEIVGFLGDSYRLPSETTKKRPPCHRGIENSNPDDAEAICGQQLKKKKCSLSGGRDVVTFCLVNQSDVRQSQVSVRSCLRKRADSHVFQKILEDGCVSPHSHQWLYINPNVCCHDRKQVTQYTGNNHDLDLFHDD